MNQAIELYRENLNNMDTVSTNSLLKAFADSDNPLTSIDLFNELISKNKTIGKVEMFIPDKVTYSILFKAISTFVTNSELKNEFSSNDNLQSIGNVGLNNNDNNNNNNNNWQDNFNDLDFLYPSNNKPVIGHIQQNHNILLLYKIFFLQIYL